MTMTFTPRRLLTTIALLGMIGTGSAHGGTIADSDAMAPQLVLQGKYIAQAADCAACHTAPGGRPFAGGLGIQTPIGKVFTTNITPDRTTGIGQYSYDDFERAVRRGVRANGDTLYPAMPFPSYARISDNDMLALFAYFKKGVEPVLQVNQPSDIPWPLSIRWPLNFWRWMFAPPVRAAQAPTSGDQEFARGAYLVEGPGHCGACHTPRGLALEEKALTDDGRAIFLSGGLVDNYVANNLRGDSLTGLGSWSEAEIVAFLKTGRNRETAAFGGMSDVVSHSTQHMTEADLEAIAHYLKSLAPVGSGRFKYDSAEATALASGDVSKQGAIDYLNNCAACHLSSGKGYVSTFPALAGNPVVNAADPSSLISIILHGGTEPATDSAPTYFTMPQFADHLGDQAIADIVTFIRTSWGNNASAVTAKQVASIRAASLAPISPYPVGDPRRKNWLSSQLKATNP